MTALSKAEAKHACKGDNDPVDDDNVGDAWPVLDTHMQLGISRKMYKIWPRFCGGMMCMQFRGPSLRKRV